MRMLSVLILVLATVVPALAAAAGSDTSESRKLAHERANASTSPRCDSLIVGGYEADVTILRSRLKDAAVQVGGDRLQLRDRTSGRLSYAMRMESSWVARADSESTQALQLDPTGPQAFEQVDYRLVVVVTPIWTGPSSGGRRYVDRSISSPGAYDRMLVTVWAQFTGRPSIAEQPPGEPVAIASSGAIERDFITRLRSLIEKP